MKRALTLAAAGMALCGLLAGCTTLIGRPALPIRILAGPGVPASLTSKEGRPLYAMAREFDWCDDLTGQVVAVPEGFVTDFASIPWYVRPILKPDGPYAQAAIIHDYLYALGTPGDEAGRKVADDMLMAAMIDYQVPRADREAIYLGVHKGGSGGYGLPSDWRFVDISTLKEVTVPRPVSRIAADLGPGCQGFAEWAKNRAKRTTVASAKLGIGYPMQ